MEMNIRHFSKQRFPLYPFIPSKDKIIAKSYGDKIYREAVLLAPGVWTDSISRTAIAYDADVLIKYHSNWRNNYLDVDHSRSVKDRIGRILNIKTHDGKIIGDLYICTKTSVGRDVVALIEEGLINWLSVEILTNEKWDPDRQLYKVTEVLFDGVAVVTSPACSEAKIKRDGPDAKT